MSDFWGDAPTWVTTVAVGFAAVQFFRDGRTRREQAEREASAQASSVWAWAGSYRGADGERNEYGFVIVNASKVPVRNVTVELSLHGKVLYPPRIMTLPPGEYFVQFYGDEQWGYATSLDEYGKPVRPYTQTERYKVHWVELEDWSRRRWRIPTDGSLVDLGTAPAAVQSTTRPRR